ncbi:MAG: hypothetical protein Q9M91_06540 [Candidatus Dojkabacteria bacterium]|nr:hypothetical protein [Candidatus Dojkabacteria bacterium]MDQ7021454.1 hypothetical protein [Candidatus Dojkabacteria bacterium]
MITDLETIFTAIIGSMLISFALAFPIIYLLYRFGIRRNHSSDYTTLIDSVNSKTGVPVMGGIIVIITVVFVNLVFSPFRSNDGLLLLIFIFILSAILGGIDDYMNIKTFKRSNPRALSRTILLMKVHKSKLTRIKLILTFPWEVYKRFFFILGSNPGNGIQAHEKVLVQTVTGLALGFGLFSYSPRVNPGEFWVPIFDFNLDIGFLIIPFALITVLLMTNAVNISDGMDGLSSSLLMPSFFGFLIIAILQGDMRVAFLIATVIGSLTSYLYFNIPPARFEMGDVGSLALGSLLAGVAFILEQPLMLLIMAFPFVITLLSSVIQGLGRRLLGRRIFRMAPLHYHLQMKHNWSEEKVVMRLALLGFVSVMVGLWIYIGQGL